MPGNTPDIDTVKMTLEKLDKRFSINKCIFVGDRGMVSHKKLKEIRSLSYEYIVGVRLNQWKEVKGEVLTTPGRYTKIEDNMFVKETETGGKRYLICYNPSQAERDKHTREEVIEELQEAIDGLDPSSKEASRLYGHQYKGRYLRKLKDDTLKIDRSQIREDEKYDGKYILLTSEKELSKETIVKNYKRLSNIERSFRSLKSLHKVDPVYHYVDRRIDAHVGICVLGHLLERVMEQKMEEANFSITATAAIEELGRMKVTKTQIKDTDYLIRTDSTPQMVDIFKALHYRLPCRVKEL